MAPTTAGTPPLAPRLAILYGSQTGNAESIARGLHDTAVARGFDSSVHCLNDHAAAHLDQTPAVLFITSSTGDGEPPDNANLFFRALRKLKGGDKGIWEGIKYALLGLGDTNYSNFCGAAKRLEKRVTELGAARFYASAFADDATGLEETIDPWVEGLWSVLETVCARKGAADAAPTAPADATTKPADAKPTVDTLAVHTASLTLNSTTPAPTLYSPPILPTHTLGHLTIPGLPDLSTLTSLTGLPAATVPTVLVTRTPATTPIRTSITEYHAQWHSRITRTPLPPYTAARPASATVRSVTSLTSSDAVKQVLALDLDLPPDVASDPAWAWAPGDAFGVLAPVPFDLALATAHRLGGAEWTGTEWTSPVVRIDGVSGDTDLPQSLRDRAPVDAPKGVEPGKGHNYSVFDLCRYVLDVTATPKKALLRALGDLATNEAEKKLMYYLSSRAGAKAYRGMSDSAPTLLHVLATVPSVTTIPLDVLLAHVTPLAPRLFSHTSTPLDGGRTRLTAAVGLVDFALPNGEVRTGVASEFVRALSVGDAVPVYPAASSRFHLPDDWTVPVVLVGAGTGIAPLVAFVRHRHAQRAMASGRGVEFGSVAVIQGIRDPQKDWLFGVEVAEMAMAGTVSAVHLAVSRVDVPAGLDGVESVTRGYVQDVIRASARAAIVDAIEQGGRVYVCGDAKGMGRGVMDAVAEVLGAAQGAASKLEAVEMVSVLVKEGRYLQDLW
ncbi:hypothetical protein AMAG_10989 [Allomyces macrogynus ATCC 38327]|uniref:Methionine synthase reductase n=1 Tax=Allomyces macrogynus (strain ATCC 38327) TaxID=578462 RepID=A0A0L0SS50_ALLM3|nr:hypothetical protein AMAG_10989 [Allomyces macrogynus ATCC 38327]|eukprot:KNE65347.1 hypothetical protein AMAG_10989 [Allomyces macrogynus ATCC 38327]